MIKRHVNTLAHPNGLWHIGGNHKLIRWSFVVHGGIDGCASNNCAPTVLQQFLKSVSLFGLPDRVRSDHGGENIDVWRYMLSTHNNDPTCIITGSSTHNERIERLGEMCIEASPVTLLKCSLPLRTKWFWTLSMKWIRFVYTLFSCHV